MSLAQTLPAKTPVSAGGPVAALVPQSLEEAFRVAGAIAASGLAPRGLDKQEQIMVAIMAGAELGLAPFQALQSFAVVNGRPTLWGDGLVAVARAQGVQVKEWREGEGEATVAHCTITRPDTGEEVTRTFSVADAKKAGLWGKQGPWQSYPRRMLGMRARAYALRDGCADMLRGFQVREEVEDYQPIREVSARPSGMTARLEARGAERAQGFDADHITETLVDVLDDDGIPAEFGGEPEPVERPQVETIQDHPDLKTGAELLAEQSEEEDPLEWFASTGRYIDQVETTADLDALWAQWCDEGMPAKLEAKHPAEFKALQRAMGERKAELAKAEAVARG